MTKAAAALLTLVFTTGAGVVVLVFMLIAMNGFSESDATWGIIGYLVLALILTVLATIAASSLAGRFFDRNMHGALAALLAAVICSVVAAGLVAVSGFVGAAIAEILRRSH